eukprot:3938994-Rhodomonas_salina.2
MRSEPWSSNWSRCKPSTCVQAPVESAAAAQGGVGGVAGRAAACVAHRGRLAPHPRPAGPSDAPIESECMRWIMDCITVALC